MDLSAENDENISIETKTELSQKQKELNKDEQSMLQELTEQQKHFADVSQQYSDAMTKVQDHCAELQQEVDQLKQVE